MSKKMSLGKKKKSSKGKRSAYILSGVLIVMMLIRLVAGLVRPTPSAASRDNNTTTATAVAPASTQEIAESALNKYFQLLYEGRYAEAMTYYGGSYDELAGLNPDDANSHADLLKDACTQNGYQCLDVKSITGVEAVTADTYAFRVEFAQEDGSLLVRPSNQAGVDTFVFPFTVKHVGEDYLVQELPVQ